MTFIAKSNILYNAAWGKFLFYAYNEINFWMNKILWLAATWRKTMSYSSFGAKLSNLERDFNHLIKVQL